MISNKAQEILGRVRSHLKKTKAHVYSENSTDSGSQQKPSANQDKTDPLFPNSADAGPEPRLPITGPDQGMLSTRLR